jgi:hypothetical protein
MARVSENGEYLCVDEVPTGWRCSGFSGCKAAHIERIAETLRSEAMFARIAETRYLALLHLTLCEMELAGRQPHGE